MSDKLSVPALPPVFSERVQITWPIVMTIVGATWYLGSSLTEIRTQLAALVAQGTVHDGRIKQIEDLSAERGPRIKALEEALRTK